MDRPGKYGASTLDVPQPEGSHVCIPAYALRRRC
jgi:hypothetical protein